MKWEKLLPLLGCLAANGIVLYINRGPHPYALFAAFLFYLAAAVIHLALHELGHLAGGLTSGYRLVFLRIGPVFLSADRRGKLSVRLDSGVDGQCVMAPSSPDSRRYICYNLGGCAANALACAVLPALLAGRSFYAGLFLLEFALVGISKLLQNLSPMLSDGFPSDGYTLRALWRSSQTRRDYALYLSLYRALFLGEEVSCQTFSYERVSQGGWDDLLYYHGTQRLLKEAQSAHSTQSGIKERRNDS